MKTTLTLKASSMLFLGGVNLIKNTPIEVDAGMLTSAEILNINRHIEAKTIESSNGLLTIENGVAPTTTKDIKLTQESPKSVVSDEPVKEAEDTTKVEVSPVIEQPKPEVEPTPTVEDKPEEVVVQPAVDVEKETVKGTRSRKAQ